MLRPYKRANPSGVLVSMSSEIHEGLCLEAAKTQLYDAVSKSMSDIESGRSRNAKTLTANARKQYGYDVRIRNIRMFRIRHRR